ncbi:MAG: multifunctional CCA tRNA nucleotidyl transferase/2'3'-cyclic phosphodiesterase/2'nucleotidase/phosphatase [Herminiimonas sp.]|nr:multifunctional CCA tRNA nucleotidyl transferase/2'3'-cyclic phosphodiesterase/2'nucleotidase/phosphatase [Herminiimonas sp.]
MQRYLVGGAVRDRLLGLPVKDRDWVVIGATPARMLALGYTPVGKDFPVFLHPQTHEEHALARTERKTAPGYKGFVFHADANVTLEQDLARRDLTINAIAEAEDGSLIDPFDGQGDLHAGLLRHVSAAFVEDPVRILRVARFSARFTGFRLAPETAELLRSMVKAGEVDALVPERVWQEFSRGLMEARPSRMIEMLRDCGALARLLPTLAPVCNGEALASLDQAASANAMLPVRLAILLQAAVPRASGSIVGDTTGIEAACARLKVPADCRDLAVMTGRERDRMQLQTELAPAQALALLERCDALRKPERFRQMLEAFGWLPSFAHHQPLLTRWQRIQVIACDVDAGAVAKVVRHEHPDQPLRINRAVRDARIAAITAIAAHPDAEMVVKNQ